MHDRLFPKDDRAGTCSVYPYSIFPPRATHARSRILALSLARTCALRAHGSPARRAQINGRVCFCKITLTEIRGTGRRIRTWRWLWALEPESQPHVLSHFSDMDMDAITTAMASHTHTITRPQTNPICQLCFNSPIITMLPSEFRAPFNRWVLTHRPVVHILVEVVPWHPKLNYILIKISAKCATCTWIIVVLSIRR